MDPGVLTVRVMLQLSSRKPWIANCLVAYWGSYNDGGATDVTETSNYVMFNDGKTYKPTGMYVTNAP